MRAPRPGRRGPRQGRVGSTLLLGVLLAGCASAPEPEVSPPVGVFSFDVEVEGENQWRDRTERFRESVHGRAEFHSSGAVHASTSHGNCSGEVPGRGNRTTLDCSGLTLSLSWRQGNTLEGTVRIPVQETREFRGACLTYDTPADRNPVCVEWGWDQSTNSHWRSADFRVATRR